MKHFSHDLLQQMPADEECDRQGEYHIYPGEDLMKHDDSYLCHCQPERHLCVGNHGAEEVWLHKTLSHMLN